MHIPKCAGSSVYALLAESLPQGSLSRANIDAAMLGPGFIDLDSLPPRAREQVVSTPEEVADLAKYSVVFGHFRLSTVAQVTRYAAMATVLREPRARLVSQYVYWRSSPNHGSRQFQPRDHALRPLDDFLSEPSLAAAHDNLVCRMLLEPDPRIPSRDFIARSMIEAVAADAAVKLDALGFVGVLELGDVVWRGLSGFFGVALAPDRRNVTSRRPMPSDAEPLGRPLTARTIGLIHSRTAADALLYQRALAGAGCSAEECAWLPDAAFANRLLQLGISAGHSAMRRW